MASYGLREAAHRAGLTEERLAQFVAAGALTPRVDGDFNEGDVRRALCVATFMDAGVPLEALAQAVSSGTITFDFLDSPEYQRLAATSNETFQEVHERSNVPFDLLVALRESTGSPAPELDSFVRENELQALPYLELAIACGMEPKSIERHIRVMGDGLRRTAETESDIWYREIIGPIVARGATGALSLPPGTDRLADLGDQMLLTILHGRQGHAWLNNVVRGVGEQMAKAGIHTAPQHLPTMCFIDVTGYTRMTAEKGDAAAAQLAEQVARIVERTAMQFGGTPVKWLGDGVMVHFEEARGAVTAALEMLPALAAAGLPPAHVGIHSGEVHFNQGDYFGQTVNLCARIADFARPGEILVSADSIAAAGEVAGVSFDEIGPVELKGVGGPVVLFTARPAG